MKSTVLKIIKKDILALFTWTGKTNKQKIRKYAIKDYNNLLALIYETMFAADATYTQLKFRSEFTTKVMKVAYTGDNDTTG